MGQPALARSGHVVRMWCPGQSILCWPPSMRRRWKSAGGASFVSMHGHPSAGVRPAALEVERAVAARLTPTDRHARQHAGPGALRLADWARSVRLLRRLFGGWRIRTARIEDRWRGIRTEALIVPRILTPRNDAHLYVPLAYGQARRVLRALRPGANDVIADVGCGLGRLVAMAAQLPVGKVIGMECDVSLAEAARKNIRTVRHRRSPTEIVTVDAAGADFDRVTVLVLFNPFGPLTMRAMLERLRVSLNVTPRVVRIAYVNPTAESELLRCGWLRRTGTSRSARYRHAVSFWETNS